MGYYRSSIENYARIVKPLYELISYPPDDKTMKSKKTFGQKPSKDKIFWEEKHKLIVESLLEKLKSPPILAYPDFEEPFVVHCDASQTGLGAVLYQKQHGSLRVISYASRSLTPAEKNYHLHSGKLEFLALKWAVCDKYREYLYYSKPFTVFSDNNPLSYVLTSAKLNATGMRWVTALSQFQFVVKYRPGKSSDDCDFMSRLHSSELLEKTSVSAILKGVIVNDPVSVNVLDLFCDSNQKDVEVIKPTTVMFYQKNDNVVGPVYQAVSKNTKPSENEMKQCPRKTKQLFRCFENLFLKDGVLIKRTETKEQIVLPCQFHGIVYRELHEKMGHLGSDRVIDLAKQRFYWPGMVKDIKTFITQKCKCLMDKKPNLEERAPLVNIESTEPFEIISIDFLHLDKCKGGFEYLLVVVDHFSRFAQAYPTRSFFCIKTIYSFLVHTHAQAVHHCFKYR